ncbi:hypothetical protein [Novosphingobium sp.]|uniref:COG3650 family protein n=1 Tax=Novosphingobium sp. TaxID=1874826 RepID=UPI0025D2C4B8|nr:hypothetical protein [Novosphingobium sp.]
MRSAALVGLIGLAACTPAKPEDKGAPLPAPGVSSSAAPLPAPKPTPAPTPAPSQTPAPGPRPVPPPTATPTEKPAKRLQALGTEPFWSVEVLPNWRLKYVTPDMLNGVVVSSTEKREGDVIRYAARFNGRPFTLTFTPGKCGDGMSDVVYPYAVVFVHSGRTDRGCGRPQR